MSTRSKPAIYPRANRVVQWFGDTYPGVPIEPNCLIVHTTESGGWPSYDGGASAPHLTVLADKQARKLVIRQHFPLTRNARALRNEAGGVETNTLNATQVELVGSCDVAHRDAWGAIFWPDAPDWAIEELGRLVAFLHVGWGLRLEAPKVWLAYGPDDRAPGRVPASYGDHPFRFSGEKWRSFYGVCGHQHVPENTHGDPGRFPAEQLLRAASGDHQGPAPEPDGDGDRGPLGPRLLRARSLIDDALDGADNQRRREWLRDILDDLDNAPRVSLARPGSHKDERRGLIGRFRT